jgi:hypothetical protein
MPAGIRQNRISQKRIASLEFLNDGFNVDISVARIVMLFIG